MANIPKQKTALELVEILKNRGMNISNDDANKIENIGYYKLKEFAKPFATSTKSGIQYNNISFKEVLTRYYQDKNLRIYLLHAIEKIEISVKARLSKILGERYGAFGYLNFSTWANREKHTKYEIECIQYKFKTNLLDSIKLKRNNNGLSQDFNNKINSDKNGFPTVWLAMEFLTFGNLIQMIKILSNKNLSELANFYNCSGRELVSWMKTLQLIRNICAHNSNLIDFKLKTKPKIKKSWENYIFFISQGENIKPTNRMSIILLMIFELVNSINPKYQWHSVTKTIKALCSDKQKANLIGFSERNSFDIFININKKS